MKPSPSQDSPLCVRFGPFELDEATYRLTADGQPVAIELKPLSLLIYLARNRDRVVSKAELREHLWPDATVSEDSLFQAVRKVRGALGETGAEGGVIQTVRGVGFRFNACIEARTEAPPDAQPEPPQTVPGLFATTGLVGRGSELARIEEHLRHLQSGRGSVVLIEGPAGIGKSRLVWEFSNRVSPDHAQVHRAVALLKGGAPSFWIWVQVLRSLVRSNDSGDLLEHAPVLARLLPDLDPKDRTPVDLPSDADDAHFLLLDSLARTLANEARERPLILLLEDLQWIDSDSAEALTFLANVVVDCPILIVGTYRSGETSDEHPFTSLREEWTRRNVLESISLTGLSVSEVEALIEQVMGAPSDRESARSIWSRTDGNPLFVRQLVALALSRGSPEESLAERLSRQAGGIPAGVRRVVSRRFARLDEATRTVVAQAAAVGPEFRLAVLARIVDLERAELVDALERAESENIIEPNEERDGRYSFSHGLLQEVAYSELEGRSRAEVHRRIAEALEELHGDFPEPVVPALAFHYGEVGPFLEGPQAADYAKWAGDIARDSCAFAEAAAYYKQALQALELLPAVDLKRRAGAQVCLGFALQNAGRTEEGRATHREAIATARNADEPSLVAAAALGLTELGVVGSDPEDAALLEDALEGLGEDGGAVRAWLTGILSIHLATLGRIPEARALASEAVDWARREDEREWLSGALSCRAAVARLDPQSLPEHRLELLTEATQHGREARNTTFEIFASFQRYGSLLELAQRDEAEAECRRLMALVERSRSSYWSFIGPSLEAGRCFLDGDFERSERLASEAFDREEGPRLDFAAAKAGVIAAIRYQQDRLVELLPVLAPLREASPRLFILGAVEVSALLDAGQLEMARNRLMALSKEGFQDVVGTESWILMLCILAETCERLGDKPRAQVLYELLVPRALHAGIVANGDHVHGPVALFLGMLAATLEDWDLAENHLEQALEISGQLRSPVWRSHSLAMQASVRAARGSQGAARLAADEALELAGTFGIQRVRRRLAAIDLD